MKVNTNCFYTHQLYHKICFSHIHRIKIVDAKQAKVIYQFLNIKRKLLMINANIWFNKQCLFHRICPSYGNIRAVGNSLPAKKIQKLAADMRMN
jgi:hypothetical protein